MHEYKITHLICGKIQACLIDATSALAALKDFEQSQYKGMVLISIERVDSEHI